MPIVLRADTAYLLLVVAFSWASNLLRPNGRGRWWALWENFSLTRSAYPPRPASVTAAEGRARHHGNLGNFFLHDGQSIWYAGVCPAGKMTCLAWLIGLGVPVMVASLRFEVLKGLAVLLVGVTVFFFRGELVGRKEEDGLEGSGAMDRSSGKPEAFVTSTTSVSGPAILQVSRRRRRTSIPAGTAFVKLYIKKRKG